MIQALESLKYKANQDLTTIGVSGNNVSLPTYTQQEINGRYVYSKTFAPQYLEGARSYPVSGQSEDQQFIQDFINLKSSYNPIDYQIEYLSETIYEQLEHPTIEIAYFIYWYDIVNVYSNFTILSELSSKPLYGLFSDSVGAIALYSPSTETVVATDLDTTDIKSYSRVIESLIADDIRNSIDQAYKHANSSYAENTTNIATNADPATSHGSRLVVDKYNTTRYNSASATYVSVLVDIYAQLMYLTPLYATMLQSVTLSTAPYFNSTIEGNSVVVDKFGNKVNINSGWTELIMLSAYTEE